MELLTLVLGTDATGMPGLYAASKTTGRVYLVWQVQSVTASINREEHAVGILRIKAEALSEEWAAAAVRRAVNLGGSPAEAA